MNLGRRSPLDRVMTDPDVGLMLAFKAGDYDAFGRLVERFTDQLVNFFYFQGGDRALAEDCAQEVWAKIFRSRSEYAPKATFPTYLFRIARNHWIDVYRAQARRPGFSDGAAGEDGGDDGGSLVSRLEDERQATPAESAERSEMARLLAEALASLPPEMREVYLLAELEGLPYAEVADVLGIPIGTVKSRMFNAVRRLKDLLVRRW